MDEIFGRRQIPGIKTRKKYIVPVKMRFQLIKSAIKESLKNYEVDSIEEHAAKLAEPSIAEPRGRLSQKECRIHLEKSILKKFEQQIKLSESALSRT